MKYAAIEIKTVYHEGHGYSSYTEKLREFIPFQDETAMKEWVNKNLTRKDEFIIISYSELKVNAVVTVTYEEVPH